MKVSKNHLRKMGLAGVGAAAFAGAILTGAALTGAAPAQAQGGPPDFSKVEIATAKLADNFYVLEGRGGSIGVLTGPDGILMVDGEFAPLTPKIVAAIQQFSSQPIRYLVDTHDHGDHTGGNENFARLGAVIVAREEVRERLMHPGPGPSGAPGTPAPAAALPTITYEGRMQFHMDGEDVQLVQVPPAHTDSDTLVYFPHADVIMAGDFFNSDQYPYIDRGDGGTLKGMLDGMSLLIGMAGPNTKIVPGHGTVADRKRAIEVRDLILVMRDRVAAMVAQGKTLDQVIASHPTADYDARFTDGPRTTVRFLTQLYGELSAAK
jgi:glyoxylase-like metal-dependent hydrolase (beta-lactamase superfamily II)